MDTKGIPFFTESFGVWGNHNTHFRFGFFAATLIPAFIHLLTINNKLRILS
jgi:hypothetical protein